MNQYKYIIGVVAALMLLCGCNKQDQWLDEKYNLSDVVPSKLSDFQQLLDKPQIKDNMGYTTVLSTDNLFMRTAEWQTLSEPFERNAYIWAADIFEQGIASDWSEPYKNIMYCNVVLEGIAKLQIDGSTESQYKNIRGQALFIRAFNFFELLQGFAKPYSTANRSEPGIALRLTSDINAVSTRATIGECYDKVLNDLAEAETLLPVNGINKFRPSKTSVQALLARVYLSMEEYAKARTYATEALASNNALLDFNTLNPADFLPMPTSFTQTNPEIIWYAGMLNSFALPVLFFNTYVDTTLVNSYVSNDLRKPIFYSSFDPAAPLKFRGSYYAVTTFFGGLATNELYLIRAEAAARLNDVTAAMNDLNALLNKRWANGTFVPFTAANKDQALQVILAERRKELPFTGSLRWQDLRRLNKDPQYAVTLTRHINNQVYTLAPGNNRYVLPIPADEIRLSGMQQNPR